MNTFRTTDEMKRRFALISTEPWFKEPTDKIADKYGGQPADPETMARILLDCSEETRVTMPKDDPAANRPGYGTDFMVALVYDVNMMVVALNLLGLR